MKEDKFAVRIVPVCSGGLCSDNPHCSTLLARSGTTEGAENGVEQAILLVDKTLESPTIEIEDVMMLDFPSLRICTGETFSFSSPEVDKTS